MAKKVGRPRKTLSDYLPQGWQETIFKMSAEGCSDIEIRAHFTWDGKSFNHNAWDGLEERDEEFSTAIKKAKTLCQAWWEKQGRSNLKAQEFQTGLWYANMKNRFGWKDKHELNGNMQMDFLNSAIQKAKSIDDSDVTKKSK